MRALRAVLERCECVLLPSHAASAVQHVYVKPVSAGSLVPPAADAPRPPTVGGKSNPASVVPYNPTQFDLDEEERLLQQVVEEALAQGVMITRAKHLHGLEFYDPRPSIRLAVTVALSKKDCEKAAGVMKNVLVKVLGKRR